MNENCIAQVSKVSLKRAATTRQLLICFTIQNKTCQQLGWDRTSHQGENVTIYIYMYNDTTLSQASFRIHSSETKIIQKDVLENRTESC